MAFEIKNLKRVDNLALSPLGVPVGLHSYATNDAPAVVEGSNFFSPATSRLTKGDIIIAVMAMGGTPVLKWYVVTSATGVATVTVALQTATAG